MELCYCHVTSTIHTPVLRIKGYVCALVLKLFFKCIQENTEVTVEVVKAPLKGFQVRSQSLCSAAAV